MAKLIPSSGSGGMGALTGLLQGLSQGIPVGQQLKNRRRLTDLEENEFGFKRQQIGRNNKLEDEDRAQTKADRARQEELAKIMFGLGQAGGGGEQGGNGAPPMGGMPPQSIRGAPQTEEQMAGGMGGGPAQGQGQPMDPSYASLQNIVQSGHFKPHEVQMLQEAWRRDAHLREGQKHAQRIGTDLEGQIGSQAYEAYDKFGNADPSYQMAAESAKKKIAELDWSDPQAAAKQLDEIEASDLANRQKASASASEAQARAQTLAGYEAESANLQQVMPGSPAANETTQVINDLKRHVITPDQAKERFLLAREGRLGHAKEMEALQKRVAQAELMLKLAMHDKAVNEAVGASPEGKDYEASLGERTRINVERERANRPVGTSGAPRVESSKSKMEARKLAGEEADGTYDREEQPNEWKAERDRILDEAGWGGTSKNGKAPDAGGDSASSILNDPKASKEDKIRRAKALGFKSFAEVEAAAKGGK